jgi:tripartite-type tricarboxylate transporter receptor subunit TctC
LRALAVGTPARLDMLPEVPTLVELGYPQASLVSLFGVFAPARTPAVVVHRLNAEINRALDSELLLARLRMAHNIPAHGSIEAFAQEAAEDRRRNRELVRGLGTRLE